MVNRLGRRFRFEWLFSFLHSQETPLRLTVEQESLVLSCQTVSPFAKLMSGFLNYSASAGKWSKNPDISFANGDTAVLHVQYRQGGGGKEKVHRASFFTIGPEFGPV